MHPLIEKSAFRKGEYIGYCYGAQRIVRGGQGWQGYAIYATASTLHALGDKLESLKAQGPAYEANASN